MRRLRDIIRAFIRNELAIETIEAVVVGGFIVASVVLALAAVGFWAANQWSTIRTSLGA